MRSLRKTAFWFKKYLKTKSIRDTVDDFGQRLSDLRADLTLAAAVGSRFQIVETDRRVREVQSSLTHILSPTASDATVPRDIEDDVLVFKPSELRLDFESAHVSVVTLNNQNRVTVQTYNAKVGLAGVTTARANQLAHPPAKVWKRDLEMFAAHLRIPGIAQIYGICKSPRLQALVFHDELVPIDIYAANINSPVQCVEFELTLIRNFTSVFSHIATLTGVVDKEYKETVADLALISTSTASLVISHLPYNNSNTAELSITEKPVGGPVHSWFSSCGCLASVPQRKPSKAVALGSRKQDDSSMSFCLTMGSLSRYRALSAKGESLKNLKLGSIYLQRPGEAEVVHPLAELVIPNAEMIIEDWTTRKGVFEELPGGWTRFEVELKTDCAEPGYFLSIHSSMYMPVAEREKQRAGWLLQAHSIFSRSDVFDRGWSYEDMVIAELFFVNLDWQLVPEVGTYGCEELPQKLYLFVGNIPVDSGGCISTPATFWSAYPDRYTADIPTGFRWEAWFTARGSARSWEAHHYEAARARQEAEGFYAAAPTAVEALGFPHYAVSALAIPDKRRASTRI
ncbi:hypothetical protein B0H13DRAFT_2669767 [Mycena leptocephala]|nr:hypothetical protein B0H13DRAFT_2669767 [Mycena leptocephala]